MYSLLNKYTNIERIMITIRYTVVVEQYGNRFIFSSSKNCTKLALYQVNSRNSKHDNFLINSGQAFQRHVGRHYQLNAK